MYNTIMTDCFVPVKLEICMVQKDVYIQQQDTHIQKEMFKCIQKEFYQLPQQ